MDQRILVPFDGSKPSTVALTHALEVHPGSAITALYVADANGLGPMEGDRAEIPEEEADRASEIFEEVRSRAEVYEATVTTDVRAGDPAETIVEYADAESMDQIVMGSHGRSGLSRILTGSVAEEVVREAPVSVTLARSR
ncbi:universal stress protein [Saliphagus sp. LR7]|uniref:universal stress protein n=1 Tax=Saliphagus sp. LR7 TaxID=2282654 RepID=UPI000DF77A2E|nr:universal stress protein [Saliphagus sp. LR7]